MCDVVEASGRFMCGCWSSKSWHGERWTASTLSGFVENIHLKTRISFMRLMRLARRLLAAWQLSKTHEAVLFHVRVGCAMGKVYT